MISFLVPGGAPLTIDFGPVAQSHPVGDVRPMLQALEILPVVPDSEPPALPANLSVEGRYNLVVLLVDAGGGGPSRLLH
jgi:hypothetical protein